MKKLLIVESPAKIKTISKFLGKDFVIMSTVGHIKDLPARELGIALNLDDKKPSIDITYTVLDRKEKVIADICKSARTADEIFLAPDPDREGEIIAWHIGQEIQKVMKDSARMHRITFNEITKSAIQEAIEHPSVIDENKVAAQQARRILDRLVGYEVSPVLWRKIRKGLSAGRVQSVALKLICDRETAIREFKPEEYWSVHGQFLLGKSSFSAQLVQINKKKIDIKDEKTALAAVEKVKAGTYHVESIKDSKRLRSAAAPFITSTLQQAAYNALGFSVQKTMQVAQKLYEGIPLEDSSAPQALITYMRTDSSRIADSALTQARTFITNLFGNRYLPEKALIYGKSKGQDAHEAVRPISVTVTPDYVRKYSSADEAKLYELIWKRFVACQMKPAEYAQRAVTIQGDSGATFKVTGSTLMFDGFLKVYQETEEEDAQDETKIILPKDLAENSPLNLEKVTPKQHFTQPPARYTEASLVKELEKEGIGRPSTYATIMKTIQTRAYTSLDTKKRFLPTDLGMAVTKLLTENLPQIMDTKFTAHMEEDLDKVAHGTLKREKLVYDFYGPFEKDLQKFQGDKTTKPVEKTSISCPECDQHKLVIRFGKNGAFVACPGYPECKFTSNFERSEDGSSISLVKAKEPQLLDEKCPHCEKPLRTIVGRYGPFTACSGYPECKYIHQKKASFACPSCAGDIIERSWKGKTFWGCKNYPTCKFSISGDIDQTICPQCKKQPYLLKRTDKHGNVLLTCPDKACGYYAELPAA